MFRFLQSAPVVADNDPNKKANDESAIGFHFPKLPIELQTAIWKLALPGPRGNFIFISFLSLTKTHLFLFSVIRIRNYPSPTVQLGLLSICHLSRKIALERYSFIVVNKHTAGYLDLTRDILWFGDNFLKHRPSLICRQVGNYHGFPFVRAEQIRHLAIDSFDHCGSKDNVSFCGMLFSYVFGLRQCLNLETFTVYKNGCLEDWEKEGYVEFVNDLRGRLGEKNNWIWV